MSAIDDLQRLHEAATHSDLKFHEWTEQVDNAWPAIHRVLVAAREVCVNRGHCDDAFCSSGKQIEALFEALRALDDKEQGR